MSQICAGFLRNSLASDYFALVEPRFQVETTFGPSQNLSASIFSHKLASGPKPMRCDPAQDRAQRDLQAFPSRFRL